DVVLAKVTQNGVVLLYADASLKKDSDVVLAAVTQDGRALEYADASLKKDKDVVLAAVRRGGYALKYADASLTEDSDVVLAAVTQNGRALEYADASLKKDRDVVLAAVRQNGRALEYADASLRKDSDVVLAASNQNIEALEFVNSGNAFIWARAASLGAQDDNVAIERAVEHCAATFTSLNNDNRKNDVVELLKTLSDLELMTDDKTALANFKRAVSYPQSQILRQALIASTRFLEWRPLAYRQQFFKNLSSLAPEEVRMISSSLLLLGQSCKERMDKFINPEARERLHKKQLLDALGVVYVFDLLGGGASELTEEIRSDLLERLKFQGVTDEQIDNVIANSYWPFMCSLFFVAQHDGYGIEDFDGVVTSLGVHLVCPLFNFSDIMTHYSDSMMHDSDSMRYHYDEATYLRLRERKNSIRIRGIKAVSDYIKELSKGLADLTLTEEQQKTVLSAIKKSLKKPLTHLIGAAGDLWSLLAALEGDNVYQATAFDILNTRLLELITDWQKLAMLLNRLNEAQRTIALNVLNTKLPELITNVGGLLEVLQLLNPEQRTIVLESLGTKLPELITNKQALQFLSPEQRALLIAVSAKTPDYLQKIPNQTLSEVLKKEELRLISFGRALSQIKIKSEEFRSDGSEKKADIASKFYTDML
ncbi:MAG: DUF4116 domain-containing protein, partial [Legionella sp.]